ncbi:phosphotransferase [Sphingomonas sp. MG17]|uniref:Hydroxylysine kinase n=1 Tax=Sphingomonas tagetis TaxID=2949092 RepID=A0A9X2HLJ1_9SPHN|nr:phosphotransferase [Sphingomonas tagetis]MCP3731474.1 phosphotransferase [Sphingomonas tagetis]
MPAISSEAPPSGSQLSTSVPELSLEAAAALAARHYGVHGTAKLLTGERDLNFRLVADDGRSYLFKVSNPSEEAEVADLQTACLQHIADRDPARPVPRVLRSSAGTLRDETTLADGRRCIIRLLTYLEGVPAKGTGRSAAQRAQFGAALAALDLALRDFAHPAASHDLLWNVSRADRLAHLIDNIVDEPRRSLVRHFMSRFVAETAPRLAQLRAQVIHNDFHLYNILVAANDPDRVTGVIDFGDLVHAPLVGEVATAAAYQMTQAADPLGAAAEFVGAYHRVLPLLAEEQAIIADLMATRHLITVLISEWRSRRYPENYAYIMRHNPEAWDGLQLMADISPQSARDRLLAHVRSGDDR